MTDSQGAANVIIGQLVAQGISHIVIAPGSRSAPLAIAAWQADRDGLVHTYVRVDERGAGFLALGLAKSNGWPVAVITTSGTAAGNLLPAVMEASHSQVPLIVITADRPASWEGFGSNQTTDQVKIFGDFVRWQARISSEDGPHSWSVQSSRAVLTARGVLGERPGPVQLNVHLAEPLAHRSDIILNRAIPVLRRESKQIEPVTFKSVRKTVIICGDASPAVGAQAASLAAATGFPLIAEPSSNARFGGALSCGSLVLASELGSKIKRVIVFGHPTLSRPVSRLLNRAGVEIIVVGTNGDWPDSGRNARYFVDAVTFPKGDPLWAQMWKTADDLIASQLTKLLDTYGYITGPALAREVWEYTQGILVVGSSNPVRDLDLAPVTDQAPEVYANRGLAGIDGTISTAIGIALDKREPTTLYCGDLTFFHDSTALAIPEAEQRPDLRIIVANDSGGSIFATLEYGQPAFESAFERVFATQLPIDPAKIADAMGVQATEVTSLAKLRKILATSISGLEVIVVKVDRTNRADLTAQISLLSENA